MTRQFGNIRKLPPVRWQARYPAPDGRAGRVRRFINPELGDIKITELTRERCERWYADLTTTLCPGRPAVAAGPRELRPGAVHVPRLAPHREHHRRAGRCDGGGR